jgi:hypothetical protein
MELQEVANPVNVGSFLPAGAYFKEQWAAQDNAATTYKLSTANPDGASYLLLVYNTVNDNSDPGKNPGDLVTKDIWGLKLYIGNDDQSEQFNWEYAEGGNSWGRVTYLKTTDDWVLLSDPIFLMPIALTPHGGGASITFSLQYDGWMHGLPDMHWELEKNDFVMTPALAEKIVNIPAGTEVTDKNNQNQKYFVKPLEVGVILNSATPADVDKPDLTAAGDINLDLVPTAANITIGNKPQGTTLKYVEGKSVE